MGTRSPLGEIAAAFTKLGLTSFGGPVAHLGYLRAEFVERRRWLSDAEFADLVALCQFLPGPASSQLTFAIGQRRAGLSGAMLASACFTAPAAVLMILVGYGVLWAGDLAHAGWLHGLKLAAAAVVAQAVWGMGRQLCPDRTRVAVCLAAAAGLLLLPGAASQVGVIAAGALFGWLRYRRDFDPPPGPLPAPPSWRTHLAAVATLALFALLLVGAPLLARAVPSTPIAVFDSFYRAGALVFGGGHVVLPLLRAEVVPPGWVSDDAFLAGYGAAQAVPGPLFTFSAYLGTVMHPGPTAWLSGLGCLVAIFLPAWLLIAGTLPFWDRLRTKAWTQAALRGANAAVVGVLLAALYTPVLTEAVQGPADVALAGVAFGLLHRFRLPPWLVVGLLAAAGALGG